LDKQVIANLRAQNVTADQLTPEILQGARSAIGKRPISAADMPTILGRVKQTMGILK
jgi:hypothetical protein